ncbi:hypothetical protein [Saliphagus infecundisoli]|uniref:Uncharacterized protein n=1 Tax=Saliphagus infecundisoli TaxID=1849069 RepID=A0ABD5QHG1_9EURY|nr:hypothetical protein [Saliphagus infecundisoli]
MNPGDYVIDTDDESPDLAVVVERPEGTIADRPVTTGDGDTRTVADDNPEYDSEMPAVVVAFVTGLDTGWPDWTDAAPDELEDGVRDHDVKRYTFPETRLTTVPTEDADALREAQTTVDMAALQTHLEDADWTTEREGLLLTVEKFDEQYHIHPTGDVDGDGQVRQPLTNIVEDYTT